MMIIKNPIFPGIFTPLMITSNDDIKVVEEAYNNEGFIGIVMLKNDADTPSINDLHKVGTAARIIKKVNLPDGGINIFISTINMSTMNNDNINAQYIFNLLTD